MSKKNNTVAVIGGGAAGLIAAWQAASLGCSVTILEKNPAPGIKIRISGGGKCNITNAADIRTMLKQFRTNEGRFLKYSFHEFTNERLLSLLHDRGVETYARENGKIFPTSHDAEQVVDALTGMATDAGAVVRTNAPVLRIAAGSERFDLSIPRATLAADAIVLATGGSSYRKTGTTGDALPWLKNFGHTVVPTRPALAPIVLSPTPPSEWQGTPIRDCRLMALSNNAIVSEWTGDVLITHFGLSGPAVLEVSRAAFESMETGAVITMSVDFYPEHTVDQVDEMLRSSIAEHPARAILTLTEQIVPQRLAAFILIQTGIPPETRSNQLTRQQRCSLTSALKGSILGRVKEIPLDRGEVTAGGAALDEVEPTTMASKRLKGLYLCGEVLDIAGPVGGYNLQAAFSTGFVAGRSVAAFLNERSNR